MKNTEDLIAFLFSESALCLPGLGTLKLIRSEAKRNPVKNKISGPKYSVSFFYNEYDDKVLSKFISFYTNKNGKDSISSENDIRKFSLDVLNEFTTKNIVDVEGLGTFKKSGDQFSFTLSPLIEETVDISYPEYPLLLMNRADTEKLIAHEEETLIIPEKKQNNNFKRTGFFLIGLSSLVFLCFLICISGVFNKKKEHASAGDSVAIKTDSSVIDSIQDEQVDLSVFNDTSSAETISNVTEKAESTSEDKTTNIDFEKKKPQRLDLESLIENSDNNKNYYLETCIVIAGSFRNKTNADRVLKKIINNGFNAYAENFDGNIRVGTISDMKKISPERQLISVKNKIEKNSWILQPEQDR